jgi:hypothetical protein
MDLRAARQTEEASEIERADGESLRTSYPSMQIERTCKGLITQCDERPPWVGEVSCWRRMTKYGTRHPMKRSRRIRYDRLDFWEDHC